MTGNFVGQSLSRTMPAHSPDLSLVLACFNEEAVLEDSARQILAFLDTLPMSSEVIFVDDASRDGTVRIIDQILHENSNRQLCKIEDTNIGRGGSVAEGICASRGRSPAKSLAGFLFGRSDSSRSADVASAAA